ncbi:hypothetical protein G9A89_020258 [Geosiphon pyriformis]|nr:hypothetical protein G9A89_020258 [Geosiphon pyriformis]
MNRPFGTSPVTRSLTTPSMSTCCYCINLKPGMSSHHLLRPYITFTYLNNAIELILGIIVMILCNRLPHGRIYIFPVGYSYCNSPSPLGLLFYIVSTVLTTLLQIYFSLVFSSYANSCREKEEMANQTSDHEKITVA